ncbi:hypothetical protein G6F57_020180 [Rhizopus arrhizus]|nr:hypothetical protein G6F57_020180 [Rhizopus arrhizus]
MRILHLRIDQRPAPAAQGSRQRRQCDLGAAAGAAEHAFAEKHRPDRHPVDTPDQGLPVPDLEGVGETEVVQLAVGLDHRRADPGAILARAGRGGTGLHHPAEGRVGGDFPRAAAQLATEAAGQVHTLGAKHHARVRRPPQDRLALAEPWKDAAGIGVQQSYRVQVAAYREQAIGLAQRGLGRREGGSR